MNPHFPGRQHFSFPFFLRLLKAKFKSLIQAVSVFLGATLLALLLAECLFRIFGPSVERVPAQRELPKVLVHQASPNLKLLYKPSPNASNNAYGFWSRINSLGFRDKEYSKEKPPGITRMIFLGDSVVYGYGVEQDQSVPKQLESVYQQQGEKVEVLNLGVSGYDAEQSVEFFKELGLSLEPDIVIAGYTLNDSIYASMELDFFHDKLDLHVRTNRSEFRKLIYAWLFSYSKVLQYLDQRYGVQRRFKRFRTYREQSIWHYLEDRNKKHQDPPESPYQQLKSTIVKDGRRLGTSPDGLKKMMGFVGIGNEPFYSSHWNLSKNAFRELKGLSRRHSFRVVVVLFPYMLEMDRYALESVHQFLASEFTDMGFQVIDLLAMSKQMYQRYGQEITNDPIHFSSRGASLIAQYLYERFNPMMPLTEKAAHQSPPNVPHPHNAE